MEVKEIRNIEIQKERNKEGKEKRKEKRKEERKKEERKEGMWEVKEGKKNRDS